ncbi:MAG: lytic transglycosylase, partial [Mycobacterium sp.]
LEHLEHPEGLGPESLSMHGMSQANHPAESSLIDLGQPSLETQLANLPWLPPWLTSPEQQQQQQLPRPSAACRMICLEPQAVPAPPAPPNGVPPAPFGSPEAPPAPMPPYAVAPAPPGAPDMPAVPPPPAASAGAPQDGPQAVPPA